MGGGPAGKYLVLPVGRTLLAVALLLSSFFIRCQLASSRSRAIFSSSVRAVHLSQGNFFNSIIH